MHGSRALLRVTVINRHRGCIDGVRPGRGGWATQATRPNRKHNNCQANGQEPMANSSRRAPAKSPTAVRWNRETKELAPIYQQCGLQWFVILILANALARSRIHFRLAALASIPSVTCPILELIRRIEFPSLEALGGHLKRLTFWPYWSPALHHRLRPFRINK